MEGPSRLLRKPMIRSIAITHICPHQGSAETVMFDYFERMLTQDSKNKVSGTLIQACSVFGIKATNDSSIPRFLLVGSSWINLPYEEEILSLYPRHVINDTVHWLHTAMCIVWKIDHPLMFRDFLQNFDMMYKQIDDSRKEKPVAYSTRAFELSPDHAQSPTPHCSSAYVCVIFDREYVGHAQMPCLIGGEVWIV